MGARSRYSPVEKASQKGGVDYVIRRVRGRDTDRSVPWYIWFQKIIRRGEEGQHESIRNDHVRVKEEAVGFLASTTVAAFALAGHSTHVGTHRGAMIIGRGRVLPVRMEGGYGGNKARCDWVLCMWQCCQAGCVKHAGRVHQRLLAVRVYLHRVICARQMHSIPCSM